MNDPQVRHKFKLHMIILSFMAMSVQFRKKTQYFHSWDKIPLKSLLWKKEWVVSHIWEDTFIVVGNTEQWECETALPIVESF